MSEETITTRDGLLFRGDVQIDLPEADSVAIARGFSCAEQLVKHLELEAATPSLVDEGWLLDHEIEIRQRRLKEIRAALQKLPAGEYIGELGHVAQVIQPSPAIKPNDAAVYAAREVIGDESLFKKLFEYAPGVWKAVKDFRAKAIVLSEAKRAKVITLCEVDSNPYVIWKN